MPLSLFEQQLKTSLTPAAIPDQLMPRVLAAIQRKQRLKLAWSRLAAVVCAACFVFSAWFLSRQLSSSGVTMFLRLLFTDTGIIVGDWRTYTLSMLEALPVLPLVLTLASSGALVWTVRLLANIPQSRHQIAH